MRFDLPELLQAERAGRAMALEAEGPVATVVAPSLEGAAALAAARHLANHAHDVRILLVGPDAQGDEAFTTMLEVAGSMDLSLEQLGTSAPGSAATCWIAGGAPPGSVPTDAETVLQASTYLQSDRNAWDGYAAQPFGRPHPFLTPAQEADARPVDRIREIDRTTMEDYALPGLCLMENAGISATVQAVDLLEEGGGDESVAIVVGYGNNGGDGLVVARGLVERGLTVHALLLGDPEQLKGDARTNLEILSQADGVIERAPHDEAAFTTRLAEAGLIVDGLFGTGLTRNVEGAPATAIRAIHAAGRPVLALDIPSGLHADTGEVLGAGVRADRTVTFAAPKQGFWKGFGPDLCGAVFLADIGCPRTVLDAS